MEYAIIQTGGKQYRVQPGDLITTGTPAGVGMGMKPQVFLKTGDNIILTIDFLGSKKSLRGNKKDYQMDFINSKEK